MALVAAAGVAVQCRLWRLSDWLANRYNTMAAAAMLWPQRSFSYG